MPIAVSAILAPLDGVCRSTRLPPSGLPIAMSEIPAPLEEPGSGHRAVEWSAHCGERYPRSTRWARLLHEAAGGIGAEGGEEAEVDGHRVVAVMVDRRHSAAVLERHVGLFHPDE